MSADGAALAQIIHSAGLALGGEHVTVDVGEGAANRCRHGAKPHPADPGYIHACHEEKWRLATWKKSNPAEVTWRPARCYSWRHDGPCRHKKASEDYARIAQALKGHNRDHVVYAVLTLDPSAWTAKGWVEVPKVDGRVQQRPRREGAVEDQAAIGESYRALSDRWHHFAKEIRRQYGAFGYVSTVEQHKSGWPHLNVIFVNQELAEHVKHEGQKLRGWGRKSKGREVAKRVFGDLLERAGFGRIAFLEPPAPANGKVDPLASYVAKLAGEAGAVWDGEKRGLLAPADDAPSGIVVESIEGHTVAEVSKYSQAPVRAPSHFRRLRSSKGFLPPKKRDEDLTGCLYDENGREMGSNVGDRMIQAAKLADTWEAVDAVRRQAMRIEDKRRERRNETVDEGERPMPRPKILAKLDLVWEILNRKERGESIEDLGAVPMHAPSILLAPVQGVTLSKKEDWAGWLGDIGPGMEIAARKYKIGNRSYKPHVPEEVRES